MSILGEYIFFCRLYGRPTQVIQKVREKERCKCQGKLADKYTAERLENACKRALSYTPRPSYKNIENILSSSQDSMRDEHPANPPSSQYGFTRGADYYRRKEK